MRLFANFDHVVLSVLNRLLLPERCEQEACGADLFPFTTIFPFNYPRTRRLASLDHLETAMVAKAEGQSVQGSRFIIKLVMPFVKPEGKSRSIDGEPNREARIRWRIDGDTITFGLVCQLGVFFQLGFDLLYRIHLFSANVERHERALARSVGALVSLFFSRHR
jgi:hypothetical protein